MTFKFVFLLVSLCWAADFRPRFDWGRLIDESGPHWVESTTFNVTELRECLNGTSRTIRYWSAIDYEVLISTDENDQRGRLSDCLREQHPDQRIALVYHPTAEQDESLYEEEVDSNGLVTFRGHVPLGMSIIDTDGTVRVRIIDPSPMEPAQSTRDPGTQDLGRSSPSQFLTIFLSHLMRWTYSARVPKRG